MTTALICDNCIGLGIGSRGVSEDFYALQKAYGQGLAERFKTITFGQNLKTALTTLVTASGEASTDDWDGYGAASVKKAAKYEAELFLKMWPTNLPFPEVAVEPDGDIALEWIESRRRMLSISFSGTNRISFAGIFGANDMHGTEYFSDSIPKAVLDMARRVFA